MKNEQASDYAKRITEIYNEHSSPAALMRDDKSMEEIRQMKCPKCGNVIEVTSQKCVRCQVPIQITAISLQSQPCRDCGEMVVVGAKAQEILCIPCFAARYAAGEYDQAEALYDESETTNCD